MNINYNTFKKAISFLSGMGACSVISAIVANNMKDLKGLKKIPVVIAMFFIGAIVGDKVETLSGEYMDEIVEKVKDLVEVGKDEEAESSAVS